MDISLLIYAVKYFGRWRAAIEAAGLDYDKVIVRHLKYPTPASVVKAIRERKRKTLLLNLNAVIKTGPNRDKSLVVYARKYFGRWRGAIEAAGLNYDGIRKR